VAIHISIKHDAEREAWMVLVNHVSAITFVGEDAEVRAQTTAAELLRQIEELYPWLLVDTREDDVA
jgi:hypothetical protein